MSSNPEVQEFLNRQTPETRKRWEANPLVEYIIQSYIRSYEEHTSKKITVKPLEPECKEPDESTESSSGMLTCFF